MAAHERSSRRARRLGRASRCDHAGSHGGLCCFARLRYAPSETNLLGVRSAIGSSRSSTSSLSRRKYRLLARRGEYSRPAGLFRAQRRTQPNWPGPAHPPRPWSNGAEQIHLKSRGGLFFHFAGRIANITRPRFLNNAKKSSSCFHGAYFLLSSCIPRSASAPVMISARACTQSPNKRPRMSQGAILARLLLRIRFAFPESAVLYTYRVSGTPCAEPAAPVDASPANQTGVRTPTPLLRKVSRLKYLCF